jgi:hypothetical protein
MKNHPEKEEAQDDALQVLWALAPAARRGSALSKEHVQQRMHEAHSPAEASWP